MVSSAWYLFHYRPTPRAEYNSCCVVVGMSLHWTFFSFFFFLLLCKCSLLLCLRRVCGGGNEGLKP